VGVREGNYSAAIAPEGRPKAAEGTQAKPCPND
jgi:hypothetical protein